MPFDHVSLNIDVKIFIRIAYFSNKNIKASGFKMIHPKGEKATLQ
jgi:hypothetical protein